MCGIFGITAGEDIAKYLVDGLSKLEYRGYDSCGIAIIDSAGQLHVRKGVGEVKFVRAEEQFDQLHGNTAIGHSRWATHGQVTRFNAHPHLSADGEIAIVHNGIIDNHESLRAELESAGVSFVSETDSEVVAHLIARARQDGANLHDAIFSSIRRLEGAFGLCIISQQDPDVIYTARNESPLLIGLGENFNCVASDPLAFSDRTRKAIILEDGDVARISTQGVDLFQLSDGQRIQHPAFELDLDERAAELGDYSDFMSKEIHENTHVTRVALKIKAEEIDSIAKAIEQSKFSYLTGIGTSYYVAVMGQYVFKMLSGRYLAAISSDELPYLASVEQGEHILAISQSGETYDTLKALRQCNKLGATTSAILNVGTSSMAREVDNCIVQGAGSEICVLSTKATISQLVILFRIALRLGERSGHLSKELIQSYQQELEALPGHFEHIWKTKHDQLRDLARPLSVIRNWFFLGRAIYHGLGLEAALKFKEVTYCHAEGMPAGALKHGTISLIDESMHSVMFLPSANEEELRTQTLGAVAEIKARKGNVVAIQPEGCTDSKDLFYAIIEHPDAGPLTNPLLQLMLAQLFAYYSARSLGRNVDKPRNLAKSVTVG